MRIVSLFLLTFLAGCARYTEAQMHLVDQARRGVELCRQAQAERATVLEQYHQNQRVRLDDAFDADVRSRADLSAAWVIEHRKAYTTMLDAIHRQHAASAAAESAAAQNLTAVDTALSRLATLQAAQLRLLSFEDIWPGLNKPAGK